MSSVQPPRPAPPQLQGARPGDWLDVVDPDGPLSISEWNPFPNPSPTVQEVDFSAFSAEKVSVERGSVVDCRFTDVDVPHVTWHGSRVDRVHIDQCRLGALDLTAAGVRNVHAQNSRISFINAAGAKFTDILFTDCRIEEVDFTDATALRVSFINCDVNTLIVRNSRLQHVNVAKADVHSIQGLTHAKGLTISSFQASMWADALLAELGLNVLE